MHLKVQAGNHNGDHQFPGLWDGRRTVLNAGLQSAKSQPHRKLNKNNVSSLTYFPHIYIRHYTIYTHGNNELGHKFLNLITAFPGIVLFFTHIQCL